MGSDDLWQVIKGGRSERLDWLSENAPLDTMATILTAMANSEGGMLVLKIGHDPIARPGRLQPFDQGLFEDRVVGASAAEQNEIGGECPQAGHKRVGPSREAAKLLPDAVESGAPALPANLDSCAA